jgi:hypothetical protein
MDSDAPESAQEILLNVIQSLEQRNQSQMERSYEERCVPQIKPPSYDSLYGPPPFRFYPEHMQRDARLTIELAGLAERLVEQQARLLDAYRQDRLKIIQSYYPNQ